MTGRENVLFAMGGNGAYFYNAPSRWIRCGIPAVVDQGITDGKIIDVKCVALGETPDEYVISFIEKDVNGGTKNKTANGAGIPAELREFCRDESGKWCKDADLNIVLGPEKSFIAWDRTSIRWCRIPTALETVLQSWLSPMGWKQGPPQFAALGKDGSFFVKSDYGAVTYWAPLHTRLSYEFESLKESDMLGNIEKLFLNPAVSDSYVILMDDSRCDGWNTPNEEGFVQIAATFATPEAEAYYEEMAAQEQSLEDEAERQRKQEEQRRISVAKRRYAAWKRTCDELFTGTALISEFPHLPVESCNCEDTICWSRKVESGLFACRHDVEHLLRGSGQYSWEWLRTERLPWHPDKFGRKCKPEVRDLLIQRAGELFIIFEELIAEARPA